MDNLKKITDLYYRLILFHNKAQQKILSDLNRLERQIIVIIFELDSCTINYLTNTLCCPKSTMTSAINRLVKKGLVERRSSIDDKRLVEIYLTPKGLQLQKRHHEFEHILFSQVLATLDEEHSTRCFLDSLEKILQHLEKDAKW